MVEMLNLARPLVKFQPRAFSVAPYFPSIPEPITHKEMRGTKNDEAVMKTGDNDSKLVQGQEEEVTTRSKQLLLLNREFYLRPFY